LPFIYGEDSRGIKDLSMCKELCAPSEEKSDVSKDSFYEELEQGFDHFPKYHMKILLGDFNAKVGRDNIFKPTTGQESLH